MGTEVKRRTALALVAVVGMAAAAALAMLGLSYGTSNPEAFAHVPTPTPFPPPYLRIDADVTNGTRPCDPIDTAATVAVGAAHKVGVCIEHYAPNSIEVFELHIRYSGNPDATPPTTLNVAPTRLVADYCPPADPGCLNVNPDANDGNDPAGFKLGSDWDCTAMTTTPPVGDYPLTPGVADALIVCNVNILNPDKDLTADPGLLATVEFTATSPGVDTIDFGPVDEHNHNGVGNPQPGHGYNGWGFASCGTAVPEDQIDCVGAAITKVCVKHIGNGKGIPALDGTVPDSAAGLEGDCEDVTYDDNNNGVMCPTDPADDGPVWDSDCDGIRDGLEGSCPLAVNPNGDDDGDGLLNTWEVCKWGTDPTVVDSDGDTLGDCREAADVDGNGVVNFPGDVIAYAKAALLTPSAFGQDGDFDIDGNSVINFPGDVIQEAGFAFNTGLCK